MLPPAPDKSCSGSVEKEGDVGSDLLPCNLTVPRHLVEPSDERRGVAAAPAHSAPRGEDFVEMDHQAGNGALSPNCIQDVLKDVSPLDGFTADDDVVTDDRTTQRSYGQGLYCGDGEKKGAQLMKAVRAIALRASG